MAGTIIIDSSVLIDLYAEIPDELKQGALRRSRRTAKRFFEVLPALASYGFEIVIPEIVVQEVSSQVAIDGYLKPVNDYFTRREASLHAARARDYYNFFSNVYSGRYPNIRIAGTHEPFEVYSYLNALRKVMHDYPRPTDEARSKLMRIRQKAWKAGFGDMAIESYMQMLCKNLSPVNIHLLGVDTKILRRASWQHAKKQEVKLLNTAGFIRALSDNDIWEEIGLKPGIPPQTIHKTILATQRHRSPPSQDHYIDSSASHSDEWANDRPFAETLSMQVHERDLTKQGFRDRVSQKSVDNLDITL